jgi:hypothetical protein
MNFNDAIGGIPLVVIIGGLVSYAKKLGLRGNWLTALSGGVGLVIGFLYQMSVRMPTAWGDWLYYIVYGILLGLTTSGIYDIIHNKQPSIYETSGFDQDDNAT